MEAGADAETEYFKTRAEEERAAAEETDDRKARDVHSRLARRYDRAASGEPPPDLHEGEDEARVWTAPATLVPPDANSTR